jgi:hypothetical protein
MFRYLNPVLKRDRSTAIISRSERSLASLWILPTSPFGNKERLCVLSIWVTRRTNSWAWSMDSSPIRRNDKETHDCLLRMVYGVLLYWTKGPDQVIEAGEMGSRLGFISLYLRHGIDQLHSSSVLNNRVARRQYLLVNLMRTVARLHYLVNPISLSSNSNLGYRVFPRSLPPFEPPPSNLLLPVRDRADRY